MCIFCNFLEFNNEYVCNVQKQIRIVKLTYYASFSDYLISYGPKKFSAKTFIF